jgi:hypothetical protein
MHDDQELLGITSLWWMRVASPIFFFRGSGTVGARVFMSDHYCSRGLYDFAL